MFKTIRFFLWSMLIIGATMVAILGYAANTVLVLLSIVVWCIGLAYMEGMT